MTTPGPVHPSVTGSNNTLPLFGPTVTTLRPQIAPPPSQPSAPFLKPIDANTQAKPLNTSSPAAPFQNQGLSLNPLFQSTASVSSGFLGQPTTTKTAAAPIARSALWSIPPSFFSVGTDAQKQFAPGVSGPATMDGIESIVDRPTIDERRSFLLSSEGEGSSKIAGNKRESLTSAYNERRVSIRLSRSSIDKGKAREGSTDDSKAPESIVYVFGHPPDSQDVVLAHFRKYGEIVEHEKTGNWLTLRYATEEAATKALENNGKAIVGDYIMGVARAAGPEKQRDVDNLKPQKSLKVIPFSQAKDIFKKPEDKKQRQGSGIKLSSGKVGLSVLSCPSISTHGDVSLMEDTTIKSTIKDVLFEW